MRQGVPFAEAHEAAGACVRACEAARTGLADLNDESLHRISPHLHAGARLVLTLEGSIASRSGRGGHRAEAGGGAADRTGRDRRRANRLGGYVPRPWRLGPGFPGSARGLRR